MKHESFLLEEYDLKLWAKGSSRAWHSTVREDLVGVQNVLAIFSSGILYFILATDLGIDPSRIHRYPV